MTVHGVVIAFLLAFPWVLVGIAFVGATSVAARRGLEHLQRAWRVGRVRKRENPMSSRIDGQSSAPQQGATMRKAA